MYVEIYVPAEKRLTKRYMYYFKKDTKASLRQTSGLYNDIYMLFKNQN